MLLLLLMFGSTLGGEPKCLSRFDYDEKMLMKLLRLEDTVAKFDTRVTELAAKYAASEERMELALKSAIANFSNSFDKTTEDFKAISASLTTSLSDSVNALLVKGDADIRGLVGRLNSETGTLITRINDAAARLAGLKSIDTRVRTVSATQSTTYDNRNPERAIDGVLTTLGHTCTHTDRSADNFWQTEFEENADVRHVTLYLRSDCCPERNSKLTVMVCKTASECNDNGGAVCAFYAGPPADPTLPVTLNCPMPLNGKFLRVRQQIPGGSYFSLCEVLVFWL